MTEGKQSEPRAPGHLEVARTGDNVLLRVLGLGNMNISLTLNDFVDESLQCGYRHFALDLGDCLGMDSTFMGTVVGAARRIHESGGWHCMLNVPKHCRDLLEMIGAAEFLVCKDNFPLAEVETEPLLPDRDSLRRLRLIKQAHENLVAIDARNLERFGHFLAALETEMNATAPDEAADADPLPDEK